MSMLGVYSAAQANTGNMRYSDDTDFIELRPFQLSDMVSNKEPGAQYAKQPISLYLSMLCLPLRANGLKFPAI